MNKITFSDELARSRAEGRFQRLNLLYLAAVELPSGTLASQIAWRVLRHQMGTTPRLRKNSSVWRWWGWRNREDHFPRVKRVISACVIRPVVAFPWNKNPPPARL